MEEKIVRLAPHTVSRKMSNKSHNKENGKQSPGSVVMSKKTNVGISDEEQIFSARSRAFLDHNVQNFTSIILR